MSQLQRSLHQLSVTTPNECEIVMRRNFDAPRSAVFDAFTKPELIRQWLLGPDGWSMPVCDVDLVVGGTYRYRWQSDTDETSFGVSGEYRDVVRPERVVNVERFDEFPGEALVTTTFVENGPTTTVSMSIVYESREARDAALETGMTSGVATSFDRLETTVFATP